MIPSNLLIKVTEIIEKLNYRQKEIALKVISSYNLIEVDNTIYVIDGVPFRFIDYIKSKCNCN